MVLILFDYLVTMLACRQDNFNISLKTIDLESCNGLSTRCWQHWFETAWRIEGFESVCCRTE